MLVLCPPVKHAEMGSACDFSSWERRGFAAHLLATRAAISLPAGHSRPLPATASYCRPTAGRLLQASCVQVLMCFPSCRWCRLERMAFIMSGYNPFSPPNVYMVHGLGEYERGRNASFARAAQSVFNGEFTVESDRLVACDCERVPATATATATAREISFARLCSRLARHACTGTYA